MATKVGELPEPLVGDGRTSLDTFTAGGPKSFCPARGGVALADEPTQGIAISASSPSARQPVQRPSGATLLGNHWRWGVFSRISTGCQRATASSQAQKSLAPFDCQCHPAANAEMSAPTGVGCSAWLGGQTPTIPIVLRVGVEHEAPGIVGHQHKPAPRNFCTINIAQFEEFTSRTGRIQFVPDELWWFCFLCRVRALLHVRYTFALFGYKFGANRL